MSTAAAAENLARFVRRVLTERQLTLRDVEMRAGGDITDGHVANILCSDGGNLRVRTLLSLARGLGVAGGRLFSIARGRLPADDGEFTLSDFESLFRRYAALSIADKAEIDALLDILSREIEWRAPERNGAAESSTEHQTLSTLERTSLGEYVRQALKNKELSYKEVLSRSRGQISNTYLYLILTAQAENLTVEKICGLAEGLGVEEEEIFDMLCEKSSDEESAFQASRIAGLYHRLEALPEEGRRELKAVVEMLDREVDRRNIQAVRSSNDKRGEPRRTMRPISVAASDQRY